MFVILYSDILEYCFNIKNSTSKKLFDIVYNDSNVLYCSKRYIDLLEQTISNKDAFGAYVRELYDTNRIKIENSNAKSNLREEFVEISNRSQVSLLLPVVYSDSSNLQSEITFLTILDNVLPLNRHWISFELLSLNYINICYQNFKNNKEIDLFFQNLFSIPKYIREVYIFDREQTPNLLLSLKGHRIKYFTILNNGRQHEFYRKQAKEDLKKALGGKLKLYFTSNHRLIHERKIIFEDILITIDNSRNNLIIDEPTWEIIISCDNEKIINWKKKCTEFFEVTD